MLAESSMEDFVDCGRARPAQQRGVQRRYHRSYLDNAIAFDGGGGSASAIWCGLSRLPPSAPPVRPIA